MKIGAIFCKDEKRKTILCYLFLRSDLQYKYTGIFEKILYRNEDKFLFSRIDHRFVCRQNLGSLRRGELRSPEKLKNIDFIYFNHTQ